jgi:hypothetical protein
MECKKCVEGRFIYDSCERNIKKIELMGVQEVRWDACGAEPAGEYIFFYGIRIMN